MADTYFQIKISGKEISPQSIGIKDLGKLLSSIEELIFAEVVSNFPAIAKDDLKISLMGVEKGSISLPMHPHQPDLVLPAYRKIAYTIENNLYDQLSSISMKPLKDLSTFTKRNNCNLEFQYVNGRTETLAAITPDTVIAKSETITGEATIYGIVFKVGGKNPSVGISMTDNQVIHCDTNETIAMELGKHLYRWVGLKGVAQWSIKDLSIQEFNINEVLEYSSDTPLTEAVEQLASIIGPYWDKIDDHESYISDLRGDEI